MAGRVGGRGLPPLRPRRGRPLRPWPASSSGRATLHQAEGGRHLAGRLQTGRSVRLSQIEPESLQLRNRAGSESPHYQTKTEPESLRPQRAPG